MNILSKVTWKAMWKNRTRTVVTIIGIILSAAMFMAVTTLGYSLWDYMLRSEIYHSGDYFLQLDYASGQHIASLSEDDRIDTLGSLGILGYTTVQRIRENGSTGGETCAVAAGDRSFYDMVSIHLEEGRLPENSSELVITRNIYHYLKNSGKPCEPGETVTLDIVPVYEEYAGGKPLPADGSAFTKTYTIVGISETFVRLNDYELYLSHLFTFADRADTPLWYRAYLKTGLPGDAYTLLQETPDSVAASVNDSLLEFYGATKYSNYNTVILLICCILAAIIMAGSVSLIYNAFSISVSERTRQFGLLSSIGATRKQLRSAVFSEAMLVSMIGIPVGLLSGYFGIAVTLNILSVRIHTLLSTGDGTIRLVPVLSPVALAAAAGIALVTVLISAAIPARRAAKISPIDAIRQKNDYAVPKKSVRIGKAVYRLFGLPGALSRKYYKVSRKKYRTTVISLVMSIVLFTSAASVSQMIQSAVDRTVDTENYDMWCSGSRAELEKLREQAFVEKAAYLADGYYLASAPDALLSEDFLACWDAIHKSYEMLDKNLHDIRLLYLEDAVFKQYLAENKIPEAPYFSEKAPAALVVSKEVTVYDTSAPAGAIDRYTYSYAPYAAAGAPLQLLRDGVPPGLKPFEADGSGTCTYHYYTAESGDPILAIAPIVDMGNGIIREDWDSRVEYLIRWEPADSGITTASYFRRDLTAGTAADTPDAVEEMDTPHIRLGAAITDLPFGVSFAAVDSYYYNYLILPLSAAPETLHSEPALCITVSDYTAAKTYLEANLKNSYRDYRESEENNRTLVLLIRVFSYGFITLISLISVANVFNTISTNVALRRRDFGMLRSTGFRERDLLKMMDYECLTYGCKALLWGFPISFLLSYLIFRIEGSTANVSFVPPWNAFLIAALCVFVVVFITMFYAISKLRRDNPIDAIRTENL